ncbi:amidohydrolase family protein [Thalassotalea sp. G2M2-11]|uniref:amidohydrolase family protein n=1 Tax=Thalassotalea sp. G2M2-11 TaxID=2787627 RepID=UPI0019D237F8|nr:amidohydrolase family protein [Thalassotalea sp. G2M2-11]
MKIIDPHLHLFDLTKGNYQWLQANQPPFWPDKARIKQNFSEQDIQLTKPLSLAGFVHIEAGFDNQQPWRELAWLEQNCYLPFKSVAYADITLSSENFQACIKQLLLQKSFIGVRYILDEQAAQVLHLPQVKTNLSYLASQQLSFECQLSLADDHAITLLVQLLEQIPELVTIINHAGFPTIAPEQRLFSNWLNNLCQLASNPNIAIKCSGWEMIDRHYTSSFAKDIIDHCLDILGLSRVMLASNFPLTLFSQSYQSYWQMMLNLLSKDSQHALCYNNAKHWYKLSSLSTNQ